MTTVGYGNILPGTTVERVFTMIMYLCGSVLYATIFGEVTNLIRSMDEERTEQSARKNELNSLLQFYRIANEDPLHMEVSDNVERLWAVCGGYQLNLLDNLPKPLQSDVALCLYSSCLQRSSILSGVEVSLIRWVATQLKPVAVLEGQFLFHYDDPAKRLFWLGHGSVRLTSDSDLNTAYRSIKMSESLGDTHVFFPEIRRWLYGCQASSTSELYYISRKMFRNFTLAHYPKTFKNIKKEAYIKYQLELTHMQHCGFQIKEVLLFSSKTNHSVLLRLPNGVPSIFSGVDEFFESYHSKKYDVKELTKLAYENEPNQVGSPSYFYKKHPEVVHDRIGFEKSPRFNQVVGNLFGGSRRSSSQLQDGSRLDNSGTMGTVFDGDSPGSKVSTQEKFLLPIKEVRIWGHDSILSDSKKSDCVLQDEEKEMLDIRTRKFSVPNKPNPLNVSSPGESLFTNSAFSAAEKQRSRLRELSRRMDALLQQAGLPNG